MFKFQLCTASAFLVVSGLICFCLKFFLFLGSQVTTARPRIPKIGTRDTFLKSYVESEFQLSRFNHLLVMGKSILIWQNLRTKTKLLRARAKSQLNTILNSSRTSLPLCMAAFSFPILQLRQLRGEVATFGAIALGDELHTSKPLRSKFRPLTGMRQLQSRS